MSTGGSKAFIRALLLGVAFAATSICHAASVTIVMPPDINQQGLTGVWYDPSTSGQGLVLEVYPDLHGAGRGHLHGGWFTYDVAPAGGVDKQRWYTFSGEAPGGGAKATVPIFLNTGGNFDAAPMTSSLSVGAATISFLTCNLGEFSYTLADGRRGTLALVRLTPNVTCGATPDRPPVADFSLSGNWYDPTASGQGFVIEVNPSVPIVFFAWYTYALNGAGLPGATGQRWFTAQGAYTPGSRSVHLTLYQTTGGVFDTEAPPGTTTDPVGMAVLTFSSCSSATLNYVFQAGPNSGRFGTIALSRVAAVPAGCSG